MVARRIVTGPGGGGMFGPGAPGNFSPQVRVAVCKLRALPLTGSVSVAGSDSGCQSVAGLPSTAASGGAPGCELEAEAAPHLTTSEVLVRSGRRVSIVSVWPARSVRRGRGR